MKKSQLVHLLIVLSFRMTVVQCYLLNIPNDSYDMNHTLSQMQIRKIAPAVIFIFMTMFTLKMFAFNRLDVKRELTLRFANQNLSDLFEARDLQTMTMES